MALLHQKLVSNSIWSYHVFVFYFLSWLCFFFFLFREIHKESEALGPVSELVIFYFILLMYDDILVSSLLDLHVPKGRLCCIIYYLLIIMYQEKSRFTSISTKIALIISSHSPTSS